MRFLHLQEDLAYQYEYLFPNPLAHKTVIILPSLTMDVEILQKIQGINHYEERLLCLLMLLRMPRTHIIYLSSMPIHEEIVDYYLQMLPGVTYRHARNRLKILSCYDGSNCSLTEKILARPRMIEKIRQSIPHGHAVHMAGFNITPLEQQLSLLLNVPLYGCPPSLNYWGTKSGSRKLFREAGMQVLPGFEDLSNMTEVAEALICLKKENPTLLKAVVKLNDGFSGDGNAIFTYKDVFNINASTMPKGLHFVAQDMTYELFKEKIELMGGIVEAFADGEHKMSPSVQCRIDPLGHVSIVSTHDQLFSGDLQQVYAGATFPADVGYNREIGQLGYSCSQKMSELGILGRFSIDFISIKSGETWTHYPIEINLRKGGTTHPFLMLQFLTDGEYDFESGVYKMPNGQSRCYVATDGLQSDKYKGLTPSDLIDIAICRNLHYDATIQEGVMFHLIGALSEYGKLGVLCVAATHQRAAELFLATVAVLDEETRNGSS